MRLRARTLNWLPAIVVLALVAGIVAGKRLFLEGPTRSRAGDQSAATLEFCREACARGRACATQMFPDAGESIVANFESGCLAGCARETERMRRCVATAAQDCTGFALCLMNAEP